RRGGGTARFVRCVVGRAGAVGRDVLARPPRMGLATAALRGAAAPAAGRQRLVALVGLGGVLRDVLGAGEVRAQRVLVLRPEHALGLRQRTAAGLLGQG